MSTLSVAPQGFWLKTHFYREGKLLHAVTYSCIAGDPEVFRVTVDLTPIINKVVAVHNSMHQTKVSGWEIEKAIGCDPAVSGIFDSIASVAKSAANLVSKVGKTKLVSQVASAVKSAVSSKVTGVVLAGAAIAFPPVGAPAIAAYAAANTALAAIKQGKAAMEAAKKVVSKSSTPAVKLQMKGALDKWAGSTLQKAVAGGVSIPGGKGPISQAMKLTLDKAKQAKALLASVAEKAKRGDVEAQKLARVVVLAKSAQDQLQTLHKSTSRTIPGLRARRGATNLNGFPALLVSSKGMIIPGRYVEKATGTPGTIIRSGKVYRGRFSTVSGDMVFGSNHLGSIGCSNPFSRPARYR